MVCTEGCAILDQPAGSGLLSDAAGRRSTPGRTSNARGTVDQQNDGAWGHLEAEELKESFQQGYIDSSAARQGDHLSEPSPPVVTDRFPERYEALAHQRAEPLEEEFFKGRYNRSRARLPENIDRWRSQPDVANPGPDLANFPNSAFTLPKGRAYIELSPFTYYGSSRASPPQYNSEFLLRYGITDDIELRLFGNGLSWTGGADSSWGFSPIAFDTKIHLWSEKSEFFIPAAGFETYIQTTWLGSEVFNSGTQPSFTFNFDQSLPYGIDLEYNLGTTRVQDVDGQNVWQFSFQWALQRDFFDDDFALFVHGFYNAMTLPRLPNVKLSLEGGTLQQNAMGAGFIWTVNKRLAVYGQVSGGTTRYTPQTISMLGLAVAF